MFDQPTFVPQDKAIEVAAMTEMTRAARKLTSDIFAVMYLPP